jgi:hypothetical protein
MRKLSGFKAAASLMVTVAVASLAVAGQAHAASQPFFGTLSVQIATLPPILATATGTATLNGAGALGHLTSATLAGGTFAALASIPVTDPGAAPIKGVNANVLNGAGNFTGSPLGGKMAIGGSASVCLFATCTASPPANVVVPFTVGGTRGIGLGGASITVKGLVNVTVVGAPWSGGTAAIGTITTMGFVHGPASGGQSSAAAASGVMSLVTPILISTNIGASAIIPAFGFLNLHFIPEPGTLLLLGAGVAGLGFIGRKKMSK